MEYYTREQLAALKRLIDLGQSRATVEDAVIAWRIYDELERQSREFEKEHDAHYIEVCIAAAQYPAPWQPVQEVEYFGIQEWEAPDVSYRLYECLDCHRVYTTEAHFAVCSECGEGRYYCRHCINVNEKTHYNLCRHCVPQPGEHQAMVESDSCAVPF